ncbi:2-amino-4-hydroxy-6-hydroxymethyldihydropteridine diphosphokinase [Aeromonas cavernicola]|uniref:2-amino-4-hydroxy-6-hydroxymethyldihydropteridine pyrophosphokinase n=1 Tax=Aeromonas cavernicola TaxID=1006623 RepID=A0A2H9U7J5_9GAMM|nr:2-amino-4-hydroxy-6-hydroxymethyldihydropteridine diphosphokinase [Aeromonas cavernicola]PJG59984.1 2-amino-4-hydroxy-6-hydroxymethyldihydropteridine diphosphokinase [Aeromonas cavernicola]
MTEVFIAIGSNLSDPLGQARRAVATLTRLPESVLMEASSFYSSRPMGPADQPDYVNAVARLNTRLTPLALLDQLQKIELEQGRVRKDERWGPRTLDLDLLLYGNQTIAHERLTVPHYGMKDRAFVLHPLAEIAPTLILPCGTPIAQLIARCPPNDLVIIAPSADEQETL